MCKMAISDSNFLMDVCFYADEKRKSLKSKRPLISLGDFDREILSRR